ncbi:MAG: tRNA lysidine(34) synthetase TilS [Candidatus Krumholzibacteriota bacterium]|nr:tRNA lysidine(34) synthetase TilS [Candidatus Krumholzibacteriota bacterium]
MDCLEQTRLWITSHQLITPDARVIAAVSGGPDSVAMLTILDRLSRDIGFTLSAAYFDHRIRTGTEKEKTLVMRYCSRLGIEAMTGSGDVPSEAAKSGKGIEETARLLRYRFLEKAAEEWKADSVALGHNRDDQAETIFHHVIRGSGWRGLTGMPVRRGIFIRPVLSSGRAELRNFLIENRIKYLIDKSNSDNSILRNRIRNKLLPLIRKDFNPSIDDALIRIGENISEGWDLMRGELVDTFALEEESGDILFPVTALDGLSDFQIYLHIDNILKTKFGIHSDIEKTHYDTAKKLIRSGRSGSMIQFPHGLAVLKEHDMIRMSVKGAAQVKGRDKQQMIPGAGRYDLLSWDLSAELREGRPGGRSYEASSLEMEFADIAFPVIVRTKSPGDRLVPFGMKGRKKLSDIFIDKKIPLGRRKNIPVFEDQKGIFWVPGVVTAERTRVRQSSKNVVYIALSSPEGRKI